MGANNLRRKGSSSIGTLLRLSPLKMPSPADIASVMSKLMNPHVTVDSRESAFEEKDSYPVQNTAAMASMSSSLVTRALRTRVTVEDQRTSQPACFHFSPTVCVEARMLETSSCIRQRWAMIQSVRSGSPMNDQNIVRRHLRPAAQKLKMDPKKTTWRALRRSRATWMCEAGVDPKSVQGAMRHARISTTMDIYAQVVTEQQKRASERTMDMVNERIERAHEALSIAVN